MPDSGLRWPRPAILLGLTAVLRAPSFARAYLSDDEAIYAVVGRAITAGGRLYVDAVDHKPPLIYWWYAAAQRVAGHAGAMVLLHALLIVVVWGTAQVLGGIARRAWPDVPGADRAAALLYVVFTTTMMPFDSLAANTELWMMLPASLSLWLMLDSGHWVRALAAGALLSVAAGFKYQAAVQIPILLLPLALQRAVPVPLRAGRVAAAVVGMALPWAAMLWWFHSRGDLSEAFYWFRFNFAYIGAGTEPGEMLRRALVRVAFVVGPAALLYVLAAAGALRALRDRGALGQWILAWAVLSAFAVSAGGRFFGHYFHQLTAPLAVVAVPAVVAFASARRRVVIGAMAVPAIAFWVVAWARDGVMHAAESRIPVATVRADANYAAVVRWLDERDPSRGSLCVWGNSPVLIAESGRPLGCRFVSANFLVGLSPATASQTDPAVDASPNIVPGMWARFESDLATRRPRFIVDGSVGNVAYFGKFPPDRYPALWTALQRDYEAIGVVEGMRVFRRRPGI